MLSITHGGIFHADEVTAEAELLKWNNLRKIIMISEEKFITSSEAEKNDWINSNDILYIIRTRNQDIISWGLENPNIYMLDNGLIYDEAKLNFDHHQDLALGASNILILDHLTRQGKINSELSKELRPFMIGISEFDTNQGNANLNWKEYNKDNKYRNLSNIISGFNRDPRNEKLQNEQFKKAVEFAIQILENEISSATERLKAERIYNEREILPNNVAVFSEFCPIWKQKGDHNFAILPNPQGWSLNSANSSTHPLPENIEHKDLIFAHKGRFIAVFKTKEAAIEVAKTL